MEAPVFQFVPLVLLLGTTGMSLAPCSWHLHIFVSIDKLPSTASMEHDPVQLRELNQALYSGKTPLTKKVQSFSALEGVSQFSS